MVHMATPWKHPKTGIYYLNRQIPLPLRTEFGGRVHWKESLRTREPDEARRLFVAANARLQILLDEAAVHVAKAAAKDEITPEHAAGAVARFLDRRPDAWFKRYPSLALTWWLESTALSLFGVKPGLTPPSPSSDDYAERMIELRHEKLLGAGWIGALMDLPRSKWMAAAGAVLEPLLESADPPIARTPANEATLMDAWNARVREDHATLVDDVQAPRRAGSKPRGRPDLRFRELLALWAAVRKPTLQSLAEATVAVEDLVAFVGDVPVEALTSDMLMDYRDEAARLAANMPRADRRLAFPDRVAKHAGTDAPRVSGPTLKKRIGAVQALLGYAHEQRFVTHNVGVGVRIQGYTRKSGRRRSFLDGELTTLFGNDLFVRPAQLLDRKTITSDLTLYWLFVLGCTSGARLEEVGQARVADVKVDADVLYIDIDDAEAHDANAALQPKRLKNDGSRRVVPIHHHATALGFERYVEALRFHGQELLFPDLRANMYGKVTQDASKRANRLVNSVVGTDDRLVFHSLRHKFKDEGRDADVQDTILDQICGHAPASVGARYGSGAALRSLKRNLAKIAFESVDWNGLSEAAAAVDWRKMVGTHVARIAARSDAGARISR
ncbi:integrase [Sphingomonas sp. UYP23]